MDENKTIAIVAPTLFLVVGVLMTIHMILPDPTIVRGSDGVSTCIANCGCTKP